MATRKIKNAKDITTDELIYFKGHAQATFMSDGRTVEDAINGINTDECPKIYTWNWDGSESGTLTQEEYDAINEADVVYVLTDNMPAFFTKEYDSNGINLRFNVMLDMTEYGEGAILMQLLFNIIQDKTYVFHTSYIGIPTKTSRLENDSNFISSDGLKTINGESIVGSGDITISGGSSSSGAYTEVSHGTSDTTFTLTPNVFHIWDEVTELNITLDSETSGVANEYLFQFTSGSEPTALTLPDDIKWANDSAPTIAENMIYQVSILKGLASVLEFSNAIPKIINTCTLTFNEDETGSIGNFEYPVESELNITYFNNNTQELAYAVVPVGTTEVTLEFSDAGYIYEISPSEDDIYIYEII